MFLITTFSFDAPVFSLIASESETSTASSAFVLLFKRYMVKLYSCEEVSPLMLFSFFAFVLTVSSV